MFPKKNPTAHSSGLSIALTRSLPCIIRPMNFRLLAIATILFLVISGCGYNPARDKDCPGCDLNGANLSKVFLVETNLTDANLTGANLSRANLSQVSLVFANLTNANLANANLAVANLTGADLDGVHGADFSGVENVNPKYLKD